MGRIGDMEWDELLTVSEVADLLRVHANTLRNWSAKGILKSLRKSQISPPACAFFCSSSSAWLAIVRSKERPQPPNTTVLRSLKTSNEAPKRGAIAPVKFLRELPVLM